MDSNRLAVTGDFNVILNTSEKSDFYVGMLVASNTQDLRFV